MREKRINDAERFKWECGVQPLVCIPGLRNCSAFLSITSALLMKSTKFTFVLLAALPAVGRAQLTSPNGTVTTSPGNTGQYFITSRGPHSNTWLHVTWQTNADGTSTALTNTYVELATGLNFWNAGLGEYVPSKEEIDAYPGGAVATLPQMLESTTDGVGDLTGAFRLFGNSCRQLNGALIYARSKENKCYTDNDGDLNKIAACLKRYGPTIDAIIGLQNKYCSSCP